jgi:hypothetical protein
MDHNECSVETLEASAPVTLKPMSQLVIAHSDETAGDLAQCSTWFSIQ